MADSAPHRGPAVEAIHLDRCALSVRYAPESADTVLGNRRGLAIAATGSVDNAGQFATALGLTDDPDESTDLLDLLARGYELLGDELPGRLRGVFAVAISDGNNLFAFRDHVGYRPLFYRLDASGLYVASEVKQVITGAGIPREPDPEVVAAIVFRNVEDDTPTALRGVRRLPKATSLRSDGTTGPALRRYWNPATLLEADPVPASELRERFDHLFGQAVDRCLSGADAVSLSGGIDSPAIAAFAAPRHLERFGTPLKAISITYPHHPSVDERPYVELLATHFDIPLHLFEQHANPVADMERWAMLVDTPFPGAALAQYEEDYLRARALEVRTMLTGEHAEFVFAMQWFTLDHFLTHGRLRAAGRQLAERRRRGDSALTIARVAARALASDRLLAARNRLSRHQPPSALPHWIDERRTATAESLGARRRWEDSQLRGFTGPGISLEAEEICQAVCGVVSRKPWTDVDLWELFLGLPAEQKFPDLRSKGLVRQLLRGRVPDPILDRTDKTVFDEAALAQVDYPELKRLIGLTDHRIDGVDYEELGRVLDERSLRAIDYMWVRTLANAHAFLATS